MRLIASKWVLGTDFCANTLSDILSASLKLNVINHPSLETLSLERRKSKCKNVKFLLSLLEIIKINLFYLLRFPENFSPPKKAQNWEIILENMRTMINQKIVFSSSKGVKWIIFMFLTRCLNVEQKTGTQTTSVDVIYVFIVGGDHVLASREEAASILLIYQSSNRDHYDFHFLFLYELANNTNSV